MRRPAVLHGAYHMKISRLAMTLEPYTAGEQPREKTIKLNTNENPYPPSPAVAKALAGFDSAAYRLYPDPTASALREAIAKREGVLPENVFVGNGSDEVLSFAFAAFFGGEEKPVFFADVTYSFYKVFGSLYGTKYREVPLRDDLRLDTDAMIAGEKDACGAVFANPNAPTSIAEDAADLLRLVEAYKGKTVIADEAYGDFSRVPSLVPYTLTRDNLLVVKTFSKSRSLAGARCGYAIGCKQLIDVLRTVKNCFNSYPINSVTAAVAKAALEDEEYFRACVAKITATRARMTEGLRALGFDVPESDANFVFASHPDLSGEELQLALRSRGIVVRRFDAPRARDRLRITVGTDADVDTLLAVLAETVSGKNGISV